MIGIHGRIGELRQQKGLSQAELAERLGWPKNAVGRFESGRQTPSKDQQEKLAACFGVSIAYLRGETNDPTRQDSWMDMTYSAIEESQDPPPPRASKSKSDKEASLDDSAFVTALLKSKAAQDIIRQIVREELKKVH